MFSFTGMSFIPFNKPFIAGNELEYIRKAVESGQLAGDGFFTKACEAFFEKRYGIRRNLLTTSCTDALEMAALLLNPEPGDEVILPSFAFVSTANAFALRGAKLVFVDSSASHPNMDVSLVENLITPKTKAIVCLHYAGMACDMDALVSLAEKYHLVLIEDAAQAVETRWKEKSLGSIGHLAAFSFHETKNLIAGEGGMLAVNAEQFLERAVILRDKGTNRQSFFRGETDKYEWVDLGSSFLPSELTAAYLLAQTEAVDKIQEHRIKAWNYYFASLNHLSDQIQLPLIPQHSGNNGHLFYLVCRSREERDALRTALAAQDILAVFHYQSLHRSRYFSSKHDGRDLPHADRYSECLLRLPLFYGITEAEQERICTAVKSFYTK